MITLKVTGKRVNVNVDPAMPLLWVLRDVLGLTGTKYMPMIWEGKTQGQICRQLKDPKQNGGKSVAAIVEHNTLDKLVRWGWNPGEGRAPRHANRRVGCRVLV